MAETSDCARPEQRAGLGLSQVRALEDGADLADELRLELGFLGVFETEIGEETVAAARRHRAVGRDRTAFSSGGMPR